MGLDCDRFLGKLHPFPWYDDDPAAVWEERFHFLESEQARRLGVEFFAWKLRDARGEERPVWLSRIKLLGLRGAFLGHAVIHIDRAPASSSREQDPSSLTPRIEQLESGLRGISTPEAGNAYLPEFRADYNRRFGREPRSPHDAHRPVRDDENLHRIFTWQEERKLSKNLTLHYKRLTYLVEPGPETLPLAGSRCRVHEHEDGRVEVRHEGQLLPCRVFLDQDPHVSQAAIVANKRLGAVLTQIRADQGERDRQRLARRNLTLRQKKRIRAAQAGAEVPAPSQSGSAARERTSALQGIDPCRTEKKTEAEPDISTWGSAGHF